MVRRQSNRHFEPIGWSNVWGERFEGPPPPEAWEGMYSDRNHIDGVLVKSQIPGDPDSVEYSWVYQMAWFDIDDMESDVSAYLSSAYG